MAAGLEPLEKLNFDDAEPLTGDNCLSAANLFTPAGCWCVGTTVVSLERSDYLSNENGQEVSVSEFAKALNAKVVRREFDIPKDILRVTDVFDAACDTPSLLTKLRQRMVDAGVVRP